MEEGSIGWDLGALDKSERIKAIGVRLETGYLQPMLCASLTVMPNIAEASRNLPQLVRYGPIITKDWMVTIVGRFMNEASLNACIAAATELVSVSFYMTLSIVETPTVDISLL